MLRKATLPLLLTCLIAPAGVASAAPPGHLEGYIPVAAQSPGKQGSVWTTDVWVFRDTATLIHLWYNPSGRDNSSGQSKVVALTEPVTYLPDVVATLFQTQGKGSIHYLADAPVEVLSRTWTPAAGGGTYGQIAPGIPVDEAGLASAGSAGVLRMLVNKSAGFRTNLGLVNVSGSAVTVSVAILDQGGQPVPGRSAMTVALQPYDMKQLDDILTGLEPATSQGLVVQATIAQGEGGILAYLSEVDNTTNSGSYQEAFRFAY